MRWGPLVFGIGIVAACGGQVSGGGGNGNGNGTGNGTGSNGTTPPACSTLSASCSDGETCSAPLTDCQGNTSSQICTCQNGRFACSHWDCGPTNPPTPGCSAWDPTPNTYCAPEGLSCPEFGGKECAGYHSMCTCRGNRWDCIDPVCVGDGGVDAQTD